MLSDAYAKFMIGWALSRRYDVDIFLPVERQVGEGPFALPQAKSVQAYLKGRKHMVIPLAPYGTTYVTGGPDRHG